MAADAGFKHSIARRRRGVFVSVDDLKKAIDEFLEVWNTDPRVRTGEIVDR